MDLEKINNLIGLSKYPIITSYIVAWIIKNFDALSIYIFTARFSAYSATNLLVSKLHFFNISYLVFWYLFFGLLLGKYLIVILDRGINILSDKILDIMNNYSKLNSFNYQIEKLDKDLNKFRNRSQYQWKEFEELILYIIESNRNLYYTNPNVVAILMSEEKIREGDVISYNPLDYGHEFSCSRLTNNTPVIFVGVVVSIPTNNLFIVNLNGDLPISIKKLEDQPDNKAITFNNGIFKNDIIANNDPYFGELYYAEDEEKHFFVHYDFLENSKTKYYSNAVTNKNFLYKNSSDFP